MPEGCRQEHCKQERVGCKPGQVGCMQEDCKQELRERCKQELQERCKKVGCTREDCCKPERKEQRK